MKIGIYNTLGYPTLDLSVAALAGAAAGGADLLEVGLPFRDPLLDGPVVAGSHHKASQQAHSIESLCAALDRLRQSTPAHVTLSLMAPLQLLYTASDREALLSRVDALLVVDASAHAPLPFPAHGKRALFLGPSLSACPPSPPEPLTMVYLTRVQGITGAGQDPRSGLKQTLSALKTRTNAPIWLGFGIHSAQGIQEAQELGADGAIIGSAFVKAIEKAYQQSPSLGSEISPEENLFLAARSFVNSLRAVQVTESKEDPVGTSGLLNTPPATGGL